MEVEGGGWRRSNNDMQKMTRCEQMYWIRTQQGAWIRGIDEMVSLSAEKSIDVEEEVKVVFKFLRSLLFCDKMR